jgi:hypothetical protein
MSVDAGLALHFYGGHQTLDLFASVLLRASGWTCGQPDSLYVPVTRGAGDWESAAGMTGDMLLDVFQKKRVLGEFFAATMQWGTTEHGGAFLFHQEGVVTFGPDRNRVTLGDGRTTDVSFYLPKILSIFADDLGGCLSFWEWTETG